ncbi:MAG: methylated-DNA--[protein]-cysteine S-methyltransferase [Candidatus Methanoplasma sp.]|jgi:methylated-DNA-[protein]-cysteine S-methyltransferase|nr:methylated-DNA--[protein]-cysteine S-methyltransferase [Candidatus Methanoplasma sp.]
MGEGYIRTYVTIIGKISISDDGKGRVDGLYLPGCNLPAREDRETEATKEADRQIDEYLAGKRKVFDIPLTLSGTDFQTAVWKEIGKIPYGETISYAELARRAGREKAFRAAGTACGANPISIIIPCHRVINSSGAMDKYGGGAALKKRLIDLERGKP